jgi:multiple sugar transport system ATP-binding protein
MIYVTHDQVEAMTMADKIVVLQAGVIEQSGSPLELYRKPRNLFVAGFIGSPKMNFLTGEKAAVLNAATIGIRPEHISISTDEGTWEGAVGLSEHLGSDTFVHVTCRESGESLTVRAGGNIDLHHGDTVFLTPDLAHLHRFDSSGHRIE